MLKPQPILHFFFLQSANVVSGYFYFYFFIEEEWLFLVSVT